MSTHLHALVRHSDGCGDRIWADTTRNPDGNRGAQDHATRRRINDRGTRIRALCAMAVQFGRRTQDRFGVLLAGYVGLLPLGSDASLVALHLDRAYAAFGDIQGDRLRAIEATGE